MATFKKAAAALALAAAAGLAFEGGKSLVENVQFARAQDAVQSTREQLQTTGDLSTVFRNVGKAMGPSVVQLKVSKAVVRNARGGNSGQPNDQFLRKFFRDHGMDVPGGNDDDNGNNNGPNEMPGGGGSGPDLQEVGTGSGVIMETDGSTAYILTNNHVAGGASEMEVTLADGRTIKGGKTIGADPKADLAVVKITAEHLIPAKWGDSDQLSRGDWVLAFGSPFGYIGSMTHGIVSALNRHGVGILSEVGGYEDFIQVDAPINPGNSGGPLVNVHGEVVGINTAIATRSRGFEGIGFAIPSNEAKVIYGMLKSKGRVTRGWLGVKIPNDVQSSPDLARSFGYTGDHGVIVDDVLEGTPASGKLDHGDIITAVNGKPVATGTDLRNQVALIAPGTEVRFTVFRDNKESDVTVRMGEQPDDVLAMTGRSESGAAGRGRSGRQQQQQQAAIGLGLHLTDLTDELARKFNLGDTKHGAVVTGVDPRSPAAKAEVQAGDVITDVGNRSVASAAEADAALGKADLKKGVRLYVANADGSRFVFMQQD